MGRAAISSSDYLRRVVALKLFTPSEFLIPCGRPEYLSPLRLDSRVSLRNESRSEKGAPEALSKTGFFCKRIKRRHNCKNSPGRGLLCLGNERVVRKLLF